MVDAVASPISDAVAVAQVSVVGAAASRELFGHGPASGAVEGAAGAEEHAAADVDAAVGSERVADHVDGFEVEAFAVPFLVHVEFERVLQVAYRFAADDAVFAADRFDAVEVRDPGVAVSAFAYLVGDPFGEPVEVGVGFEEAGHVAAGPFALEVVIDRPADEHGRGAAGVLAMGFQSVSYLDYAGVRRCWMGSPTGRVLGLIFGWAVACPLTGWRGG